MAKAPKNVVVDEDEEEEEVVVKPKATTKKVAAKAAVKNSKVIARAAPPDDDEDEEEDETPVKASKKTTKAAPVKKAKAEAAEPYTPNKNSMRDFVMRAMKKGGNSEKIKARAAALATKAGVEELSDPKKYKNFDVAYFAKFLQGKGMEVEIDEEADTYTLSA